MTVPTGIPSTGFAPRSGIPFNITVPGTNVSPFANGSIMITEVAGTDPRFWKVTVYVIISFISTICLSASLFGLGVGVITDTSTVGVGCVMVIGVRQGLAGMCK